MLKLRVDGQILARVHSLISESVSTDTEIDGLISKFRLITKGTTFTEPPLDIDKDQAPAFLAQLNGLMVD